jgi:membrane protease YdiL (CAAX protease family)
VDRTVDEDVADEPASEPSVPDAGPLPPRVGAALRAALIGGFGLVAIQITALLLAAPVVAATGELTTAQETLLSTVATGVGLGGFGLLVLQATDRDGSYLDLAAPDRRDVAYAVGGSVLLIGAYVAVALGLAELGIAPSEHGISQRLDAGDAWVALALVALSYLAVGPGEEFVYRNIVQKSLYDAFPRGPAILVASAVFALVHLPAYATRGFGVGAAVSLSVVFLLALGLGWLYARTDNLVVPTFAHGTFNAVQFLLLYVQLSGGSV